MNLNFAKISLLLLSMLGIADAQTIVSGPQAGIPLTPVKVYDGLGAHAGKEFDAAAEIGPNPGALLFVHIMTRNTYHVIRGLDQLAGRNALMGFKSYTIYLTADRTSGETQARLRNGLATGGHKFSVTGKFGALKLENPIMLNLDGKDGPGNYALNRRAVLTLVMLRDGKVHSSHAFTDTGEQDLPLLERLVGEVVGPMPEDAAGLRKIRDERLPKETAQLRKLAIQFQAFWGASYRRGHPMLPVIEEITGPLPKPDAALAELIDTWLPTEESELRAMALRQAQELFDLQTKLNAAKSGQLRYTAMKTAQIRQGMKRPSMVRGAAPDRKRPQRERAENRSNRDQAAVAKPTGKAPTDAQLNSLMRAFIRKSNSRQTNQEIFQDIQTRSQESSELRGQSVAMFQFMLSGKGRFGNDQAQELSRKFLNTNSAKKE